MIQDWDQVVWKKSDPVIKQHTEGEIAVREMSYSIQKAIQQSRLICKMSQKELAKQLNVTTSVIIDYENGSVVPNNAFIAKMEKIMNTKLPRATKKKIVE
jgi:ribosome-binding protein aMBF1 (putative translation factor)